MCGIYCSLLQNETASGGSNGHEILGTELEQLLLHRGPDASSITTVSTNCENNVEFAVREIQFAGFVLWQQGRELCSQPVKCNDIILLFNGDTYNVDDMKPLLMPDSSWLASIISNMKDEFELCRFLRTLEGPFSLILFNKATRDLYFCRDSLGRNSLLIEKHPFMLRLLSTSYYADGLTIELPPLGLFKMNMSDPSRCSIFPWSSLDDEYYLHQIRDFENTLGINLSIRDVICPKWLNINTTVEASFNFYDICNSSDINSENIFEKLLANMPLFGELNRFASLLENSVQHRVQKTPNYCKNCILSRSECNHSKIGILFSGGIDCSILAVLANKFADKKDSIDLINVAFENINAPTNQWDVPDRCSSRASYKELLKLCPLRKWNFIEVNVSRKELYITLQSHIKHLIYPLNTILDESIGCAFWFASRGKGICNGALYESSTRVIIVGSGADELFGGYSRHRSAYLHCKGDEQQKQEIVREELEKDWRRIPSRNLARDDRVISDNGKTARAPFIEENLVHYVRSLKPSQRCCFILEQGLGDKLFLRVYGYLIGLRYSVTLKKRAIQFGSRIANKRENAKDISEHLKFI